MSEQKSNSSSGLSFASVLFIVFLTLKLCGVITWSWWWVTAPLWIAPAVLLAIAGICLLIAAFDNN